MSAETESNGFAIPPLEPGGRRTFLSASFGNFVIRRVNALVGLKVQRGARDSFTIADGNAVLTLARDGEGESGTSSLQVYKVTSIANLSSNYIAGKTVSFDNSNTETLGASAVNIALPWALRNAQVSGRTPEYAVDDYILVTTCENGTGVAVSSVQLTLEDLGIGRIETPTAQSIERFRVKSVQADYLTCRTWDGTTEGGSDIYIAKAPKLRHVASESIEGVTVSYTYASRTNNEDGKRSATDGTTTEDQIVVPVWIDNDEIFATKPLRGTDVTVSSVELEYLDMNVDGRVWAAIN